VRLRALLFAAAAAAGIPAAAAAQAAQYDLVLRNGRIVDGTGSPWYRGDVAIVGDEIVRVAPSIEAPAARVIDVAGQVIAPGFIDLHSHGDRDIFETPAAENLIRQGVTTIMGGPDGGSAVPLGPFLDSVVRLPRTVNFGSMIGHGSVRSTVVGQDDRRATPEEMERMKALVEEGMRDGAFGLSTGLFYVPGTFAPIEEVIELARVAARSGGYHTSHMRDEASGVLQSVEETIRIGEEGGLPTQVTHHKIVGKPYWGASERTLRLIDEARARGVDATIDQYPYTASSTSIQAALLPSWVLEGGMRAAQARLADGAMRERIREESAQIIENERGGGDLERVVITRCAWDPSLAGKTLGDVARMRGLEPTMKGGAEAVMWLTQQGGCGGVFHAIDEADVQRIMAHPATMIASDGGIPVFGRDVPHPRSYGTFAKVLGEYVRDKGVLPLEDAVRKMSSYPAQRAGLADRGLIRAGMKADLAVFDPATVRETATFERPHQYAEGFSLVVVNGQVVLEGDRVTEARPGVVLYGPGKRAAVLP
jgi:dihydroorotase/N-acyl-D-amino-acid deacylase